MQIGSCVRSTTTRTTRLSLVFSALSLPRRVSPPSYFRYGYSLTSYRGVAVYSAIVSDSDSPFCRPFDSTGRRIDPTATGCGGGPPLQRQRRRQRFPLWSCRHRR